MTDSVTVQSIDGDAVFVCYFGSSVGKPAKGCSIEVFRHCQTVCAIRCLLCVYFCVRDGLLLPLWTLDPPTAGEDLLFRSHPL